MKLVNALLLCSFLALFPIMSDAKLLTADPTNITDIQAKIDSSSTSDVVIVPDSFTLDRVLYINKPYFIVYGDITLSGKNANVLVGKSNGVLGNAYVSFYSINGDGTQDSCLNVTGLIFSTVRFTTISTCHTIIKLFTDPNNDNRVTDNDFFGNGVATYDVAGIDQVTSGTAKIEENNYFINFIGNGVQRRGIGIRAWNKNPSNISYNYGGVEWNKCYCGFDFNNIDILEVPSNFVGNNKYYLGYSTDAGWSLDNLTTYFNSSKISISSTSYVYLPRGFTRPTNIIHLTQSPFVYRNVVGYDVDAIISGGIVNNIEFSTDGINYYSAGVQQGRFLLRQGEYMKVTYTVSPNMVLSG